MFNVIGQIAYIPKARMVQTIQAPSIRTSEFSQNNIQVYLPSKSEMAPTTQIDLFQGWPATAMLPVERLKQAANYALSNKAIFTEGFAYGPDEGYSPLRKNIAEWLSRSYAPAQPISAERICITGGASQNLACVLQVFTDPAQTEMIWLVEPTYHLVFRVFEDAGFSGRMRGIPEDGEGMNVGALELALDEFERSRNSGCQDGQVCAFSHAKLVAFEVTHANGNRRRHTSPTGRIERYTSMSSIVSRVSLIRRGRQCLTRGARHLSESRGSTMFSSSLMMCTTFSVGARHSPPTWFRIFSRGSWI